MFKQPPQDLEVLGWPPSRKETQQTSSAPAGEAPMHEHKASEDDSDGANQRNTGRAGSRRNQENDSVAIAPGGKNHEKGSVAIDEENTSREQADCVARDEAHANRTEADSDAMDADPAYELDGMDIDGNSMPADADGYST